MATTDTDLPVGPNGGYIEPTWAEGGGALSVPPAKDPGLGSVALASNDLNYQWREIARWVRAMFLRMPQADQAMFASWIQPTAVDWIVPGGTLDSSILPVRVWIDGSDDGSAKLVEFTVPVGAPHTFTASRDTWVALDDAGAVEYNEVVNGGGVPTPTAGFVHVWRVVTDGAQVTSTFKALLQVPLYKSLTASDIVSLATLTILGLSDLKGDVVLGTDGANTVTMNGVLQSFSLGTGQTFTCTGTAQILGTGTTRITTGVLDFAPVGILPTSTGLSVNADGVLFYGVSARVHYGARGFIGGSGYEEGPTALLTNIITAETGLVTGDSTGQARVTMTAEVQIQLPGTNIVRIHIEQDQGIGSWLTVGVLLEKTINSGTVDLTNWDPIKIVRIHNPGTSFVKYRARIDPIGTSGRAREVDVVVTQTS